MSKGITKEQHEILRHSLGLNRKSKAYRNYYADEPDSRDCNILCNKGMMQTGVQAPGGLMFFQVTNFGRDIAKKKYEDIQDGEK